MMTFVVADITSLFDLQHPAAPHVHATNSEAGTLRSHTHAELALITIYHTAWPDELVMRPAPTLQHLQL